MRTAKTRKVLSTRVIPCLDVHAGRVVKGVNFVNLVDAGDPVEQAKVYEQQGADELVFLDITASSDERAIMLDVVERTAGECFMPLTVGGGLRTLDDIRAMLAAGADKVSLNTAAVKNPDLIRQASEHLGNQCIVVAIDARLEPQVEGERQRWQVYTHGGRTPTGLDAIDWAQQVVDLGAGEILLTSMDADGTKAGFDHELTHAITQAIEVPVIASGGAGALQHFSEIVHRGNANAVLAASVFHFGTFTIDAVKAHMEAEGLSVRRL